jgi:hypothetical protein
MSLPWRRGCLLHRALGIEHQLTLYGHIVNTAAGGTNGSDMLQRLPAARMSTGDSIAGVRRPVMPTSHGGENGTGRARSNNTQIDQDVPSLIEKCPEDPAIS